MSTVSPPDQPARRGMVQSRTPGMGCMQKHNAHIRAALCRNTPILISAWRYGRFLASEMHAMQVGHGYYTLTNPFPSRGVAIITRAAQLVDANGCPVPISEVHIGPSDSQTVLCGPIRKRLFLNVQNVNLSDFDFGTP